MMSRSIELGRAVLSSPVTNHELWLTTLITISAKQDATYLQQLTSAQYLDVLTSGTVWVNRGHDMHVEMKINICEESLPNKQLQDLTNAALHAPIWEQLMLKPIQRTDIAVDPGTMRLDINHASATAIQEGKKHHKLFLGVPAADVRPPEGITEISLQSVRLCMDIFETRQPRRLTVKRSNSSPSERKMPALDEEDSDTLLHEMNPNDLLYGGDTDCSRIAPRTAAYRKRKRPATETVISAQSYPLDKTGTLERCRKRPTTDHFMQRKSHTDFASSDRLDVASMVDVAMRLSICGTLTRTLVGWKAKASTFRIGLADVAPAIWRTGYLVAISQRAHLGPTIARSLSQIASVNSTSISLRDKMRGLSTTAQGTSLDCSSGKRPFAGYDVTKIDSAIAGRLWVESQRNLLNKPMAPIQACIASSPHPGQSDSDDMLAEEESCWNHSRRTTPFDFIRPSDLCDNKSTSVKYVQTPQDQRGVFCGPFLDINFRESEDDLLLESPSQTTMLTTACSVDKQLRTPSISHTCFSLTPLVPIQRSVGSSSQPCLNALRTVQLSSGQSAVANPGRSHEPLLEDDVHCTEDLLPIP